MSGDGARVPLASADRSAPKLPPGYDRNPGLRHINLKSPAHDAYMLSTSADRAVGSGGEQCAPFGEEVLDGGAEHPALGVADLQAERDHAAPGEVTAACEQI